MLTDRDEMSNHNRGLSIESPVVAMFVNGLGRNDYSLERIFYRCFLPSFGSFGLAVSEINQSETRLACGGHVCKWIRTK